jgi:hypothetical protein
MAKLVFLSGVRILHIIINSFPPPPFLLRPAFRAANRLFTDTYYHGLSITILEKPRPHGYSGRLGGEERES